MNVIAESIGAVIRLAGTCRFPGKNSRLIPYFMRHCHSSSPRTRVLPGGAKVACDLAIPYECMVWLGQEEEADLHVLQRLLMPGQTFVDCGANIGIWALVAASAVGTQGRVLAIEPIPEIAARLRTHAAPFPQVSVIEKAVGDTAVEVLFQVDAEHNRSAVTTTSGDGVLNVQQIRLDDIVEEGPVHGCKIDVEGSEMRVLEGMARILREYRPWICIEFNTVLAGVSQLSDWEAHRYLRGLGYSPYQLHDAPQLERSRSLPEDWSTTGYCNLFYAKQSQST